MQTGMWVLDLAYIYFMPFVQSMQINMLWVKYSSHVCYKMCSLHALCATSALQVVREC